MGVCESINDDRGQRIVIIDGEEKLPGEFWMSEKFACREPISNKYNVTKKIVGHGATCTVLLANDNKGKHFAIKKIKKKDVRYGQLVLNEARIGITVNHPNIIKIKKVYEDLKTISFVMEIIEGGDLFDFITKSPRSRLEPYIAINLMIQMFDSLSYLHDTLGVCHRDIKPENFLVSIDEHNSPILHLIDFGYSKYIDQEKKFRDNLGSPDYLAPEMVSNQPYDQKVDIWSAGIVLFNMMTGCQPFNESQGNLEDQIKHKKINFNVIQNEYIREFLTHLLERDVTLRFSAKEALEYAKKIQPKILQEYQ